jgi:hypothetical protein
VLDARVLKKNYSKQQVKNLCFKKGYTPKKYGFFGEKFQKHVLVQ